MGDELNTGLQPGQAGQPVTPSQSADVQSQPSAGEGSDGGAPQYVTKSEALQMAKDAANEAVRQAQSLTDKSQARIIREVERLTKNGIQATPEQVQKMIAAEEQSAQSQTGAISGQQAAQPAQEMPTDPMVRKAVNIMQEEAGGAIPQDAPEFKLIDSVTDDPEVFLKSVHDASQAYAKRTGNLGNPARIPSLSNGSETHRPAHEGKTGLQTLDDYYNRILPTG